MFEPFFVVAFNFCEVAVVIGMLMISPGGHSEGFRADAPCTLCFILSFFFLSNASQFKSRPLHESRK